jgi:hypothetical protein
MVMFSILSWWCLDGLKDQFKRVKRSLAKINDQFSIPLLFKTLFSPFRMIDADKSYGPSLEGKMKAGLDKMVSRIIGGFIRSVVIIIGVIVLFLAFIFNILKIIFWIILPVLPIVVLVACIILGGVWI